MKHVAILGGGSAAFSAVHRAHDHGARVTVVHKGLPLGGTCLNVGCVPSKAYIRAAETLYHGKHCRYAGIETSARLTDFAEVFREKQEMVDTLRRVNYEDVVPRLPDFELVREQGQLVDANTVRAGDRLIEADCVLVATGSSTFVPPVEGLATAPYLTNDTVFELRELPARILVLGGRYIALECAQMLSRFGVEVTVLQRSDRILPDQPADLTENLTELLQQEGLHIRTGVHMERVEATEHSATVEATIHGEAYSFSADRILVATGRRANTANIGLEEAGVKLAPDGSIETDTHMQTTLRGVYAAGDAAGDPMFVYAASYESEIAMDHALAGEQREAQYDALPWVVFTDPQVAGTGVDELGAAKAGHDFDVATLPSLRVPRLRVGHDDRGFLRLIRNRKTDQLLGARFLCHEAGELATLTSTLMQAGATVAGICNTPYPYLTLSEGLQRTALQFEPA